MVKKNENSSGNESSFASVSKRLDALIRIILEIHLDKHNAFNLTAAVKALNSCGLGPKEIADIMGRKMTDIAPLLYRNTSGRKQRLSKSSRSTSEEDMNG